jgi:Peptidase M15
MRRPLLSTISISCMLLVARVQAGPLTVAFQDREISDPKAAVFVLPGQAVDFVVDAGGAAGAATMRGTIGALTQERPDRWQWGAPTRPGSFGMLHVVDPADAQRSIALSVFVLVPVAEVTNGFVGDFRVDAYPRGRPKKNPQDYAPPAGFVEVTEANRDLPVSPHFKIGQFVSKQTGDWPKYVVPSDRLYLKLEGALEAVRRAGFDAPTLYVMSGYRTPYYNRRLGNVPFSRHIYGDAADVFVDIDENGYMDDLNGDGIVSVADAVTMARWLDTLAGEPRFLALAGGLGVYDSTRYHGPFIHVDARGYDARWGLKP